MKRSFIAAGAVAGLLLLGAPTASAAVHKDVTVTGAGATFPLNMIELWKAEFFKSTGVTIAYTGVGSGAGRAQLIAGTVDYAASDVPASAAEVDQLKAKYGDFVYIPFTAGGLGVHYNVPGLTNLKLSASTIAKIFAGTIINWNDPAIAADNGAAGPNLPIQVFVRSDKSGTSGVFTDYLAKAAPADWTKGKTETFPTDRGQIGKAGSDGVSNAVKTASGGIGYGEHSFAVERQLPEVLVKNGAGEFKGPETAAVTAALEAAMLNPDNTLTLNYTTTKPGVYPLSTTSYLLVPAKMDPNEGDNLISFLNYVLGDGQSKAAGINYAPVPDSVRRAGQTAVTRINATVAQAAPAPEPVPVSAPAPAPAPAPATTAPKPAPKPAAAKPAPKPAATAATADAQAAPDPALANTGSSSTLAATLAGSLLALGGLCVGVGRKRRAVRV
ncbi:MAG TPA: phosphate ABC transporter substrate-binding protein PstS [Acidimicrobiia bacterium]|nr:phosphate ABC transporter substrate-binding protein PstS [Acidimicrobiia bacterium]